MLTKCNLGGILSNSNNKKKGYTLIELLAVIVILAIIAVIALPVVINVIEKANKQAAIDSTYGYIDAINKENQLSEYTSERELIEDGEYDVIDIKEKVKIKGRRPAHGNITIEKATVTSASLCINEYIVDYDGKIATTSGIKCEKDEKDLKESDIVLTTNTTTKSIRLNYVIEDEVGIKEVKLYFIDGETEEEISLEDKTSLTGTYLKDNLESNKKYTFRIEVKNIKGKKTIKTITVDTVNMQAPQIGYKNEETAADWEVSKILKVTYEEIEGTYLEYQKDGHEDNKWERLNNSEIEVTKNEEVFVRITDGKNNTGSSSIKITKIDTTEPSDDAPSGVVDTESITVTSNQRDEESDINTDALEYGISTSENGTYEWQSSNVFSGKTRNTDYYIKTRANNNARVNSGITEKIESEARKVTTKQFTSPTVVFDDTEWDTSHIATATYTKGEITNAYYYVKSTSGGTSNIDVTPCTGTLSGTTKNCSGDSTKNMSAGVWYQVGTGSSSTASVEVTLTLNGTVYAAISDGSNLLDTPTAETTHIDDKAPECGSFSGGSTTWALSRTISVGCTDENTDGSAGSGCKASSLTKTYTTTTETATPSIVIEDGVGRTTTCTSPSAMNIYVDASEPSASISSVSTSTTTATVYASCSDGESDISKYEFSKNGGTSYTSNGTTSSYKFTGLTSGSSYNFKVRCTNGVNKTATSDSTSKTIGSVSSSSQYGIVFESIKRTPSSTTCARQAKIDVNYSYSNITNPKRYWKVSVGDVAKNDITATKCGTSTSPSLSCSGTLSGSSYMSAGEWYTTTSWPTITIDKTVSRITIYGRIHDGNELLSYATYTITDVDTDPPGTTKPTVSSITTTGATLTNKQTDGCGLDTSTLEYGYSTSAYSGYTWQSSRTLTGLSSGTTYYVKTRVNDEAGNGLTTSSYNSFTTTSGDTTPPSKPTISNPSNEVCTGDSFALTLSSTDNVGIAYYQYTYSSSATTTGTDNGSTWVTYANSASTSYTTTAFSAQRNQLVYVRACDSAGNCSSSNSTYIRIGTAKTSNTACYSSVQLAVNAISSGTVTLLKNASEGVSVASGKSLTLNLNGKTLTGSLSNSGTLTINGNGKITGTGSTAISNSGTLTITNGTFQNTSSTTARVLDNSGTCTINGGTFSASDHAVVNRKTMTVFYANMYSTNQNAFWQTSAVTSSTIFPYDSSKGRSIVNGMVNSSTTYPILKQYTNNSSTKSNSGFVISVNPNTSQVYNVIIEGKVATSCKARPSNGSLKTYSEVRKSTDSDGKTYYYCLVQRSDFTNPTDIWYVEFYNGSTLQGSWNGWKWVNK